MSNPTNIPTEDSGINIKEVFYQAFNAWYWYLLSITVCCLAAWIYLRYTPPVYSVQTTILIKDDKSKIGPDAFIDGLQLLAVSKNVLNEIEVIRSFNNIKKTVDDLNLEVSYFVEGNIKTGELYTLSPFTVRLDTSFNQTYNTPVYIHILSDSTFGIRSALYPEKKGMQEYAFGVPCQSPYYSLIVNKSPLFKKRNGSEYYFIINDIDKVTQQYLSKIKIELSDKKASILVLSSNGLIPAKEIDFLNTLCEIYLQAGLDEKNLIAVNTIRFIDAQLGEITDSLRGAEKNLEKFRSSEKMISLNLSADKAFTQLDDLEKERAELLVKLKYYAYLLEYVKSNNNLKDIIAPSALGIQDQLLNTLIAELHMLSTEKASLGFSTKEQNPTSHIIDLKIENTEKSLIENLKNIIKSSEILLQDNTNRLARVQELINKLPGNERSLVNIQRKFMLSEYIYNYLMQKRIEAGIAKASNLADHKVINKAMLFGNNPIAPKKAFIFLISFLIGIIVPSGLLYAKASLNDTVMNKETIERLTNIPVIGTIAHSNDMIPIIDQPKSSVSESIRSLRVNLQYLAINKTNKVIGITSSISGEGKTFFSVNLAASIAMSGTKVVIIGADLRKPKLNKIFNVDASTGLSNFYINQASIQQIIQKTNIPCLDIIVCGPIPPNPIDLLESAKTEELITFLKTQYDFIIIDAPPVGLVADYYIISKYTDSDLFLIRQNYTKNRLLKEINVIHKNKTLRNMFLVFNDVKYNTGYGYYYGYNGYYEESPSNRNVFIRSFNTLKKIIKF